MTTAVAICVEAVETIVDGGAVDALAVTVTGGGAETDDVAVTRKVEGDGVGDFEEVGAIDELEGAGDVDLAPEVVDSICGTGVAVEAGLVDVFSAIDDDDDVGQFANTGSHVVGNGAPPVVKITVDGAGVDVSVVTDTTVSDDVTVVVGVTELESTDVVAGGFVVTRMVSVEFTNCLLNKIGSCIRLAFLQGYSWWRDIPAAATLHTNKTSDIRDSILTAAVSRRKRCARYEAMGPRIMKVEAPMCRKNYIMVHYDIASCTWPGLRLVETSQDH